MVACFRPPGSREADRYYCWFAGSAHVNPGTRDECRSVWDLVVPLEDETQERFSWASADANLGGTASRCWY